MLEEQIKLHKAISKQIEQLEEQKKQLGMAILNQMKGQMLQIPGYCVKRYKRLSIKVPIEEARNLNAIKFEETVDRDKIKLLLSQGQSISGVSEIQYIQILETKS